MHFWKMQHQTALGDHKCFIITFIIIVIINVIIVVVVVVSSKLHGVVTIVIVVRVFITINTKLRSHCSSVIFIGQDLLACNSVNMIIKRNQY